MRLECILVMVWWSWLAGLRYNVCYYHINLYSSSPKKLLVDTNMSMRISMKGMLMMVVVDIFALSMTGTVADAVAGAIAEGNVTGASDSVLPLVTLAYVMSIVGINIGVLWKVFR